MNKKNLLQTISEYGYFVIVVLLFAVGILLIWFLITGFSKDPLVIAIGIAALSAFFAAVSSIAGLIQATETRQQRENQERPYIVNFFDSTGRGAVVFEIRNDGNSPAFDIRFSFDPIPVDFAGRKLSDVSIFKSPISFMPQARGHRQLINSGYNFIGGGNPLLYRVRITYKSNSGKFYEENVQFDLSYLKEATYPPKSITDNLEDIATRLGEINTKLMD